MTNRASWCPEREQNEAKSTGITNISRQFYKKRKRVNTNIIIPREIYNVDCQSHQELRAVSCMMDGRLSWIVVCSLGRKVCKFWCKSRGTKILHKYHKHHPRTLSSQIATWSHLPQVMDKFSCLLGYWLRSRISKLAYYIRRWETSSGYWVWSIQQRITPIWFLYNQTLE